MNEEYASQTALGAIDEERLGLTGFRKSVAVIALEFAAATTLGVQRCFLRGDAAGTQAVQVLAESSTQMREATPEIRARLDAMLDAARHDIIEDGENNTVTERLAELFLRDFHALIPVLSALIESGRTPPTIAAELLKELGRIRDAASHKSRRWLLERALSASSPFVRDGAGLGLARLADPAALHYLRKAIQAEENSEARADLQLVVDELSETVR